MEGLWRPQVPVHMLVGCPRCMRVAGAQSRFQEVCKHQYFVRDMCCASDSLPPVHRMLLQKRGYSMVGLYSGSWIGRACGTSTKSFVSSSANATIPDDQKLGTETAKVLTR